jgi:hypothetical protein
LHITYYTIIIIIIIIIIIMSYVMMCSSNLVQLVALLFLVVGPITGTLAIRDSINEKVLLRPFS